MPVEKPEKTRRRLFLIDGYALIYRAFFAMISRPLITSKGENTSAAWGFTRFLMKLLEEHTPDYLGVVFDAGSSQRPRSSPTTRRRVRRCRTSSRRRCPASARCSRRSASPCSSCQGFEADDVIGTLVTRAVEAGLEAVIVSGDKDFYQLISPDIWLLNPGRGGPAAWTRSGWTCATRTSASASRPSTSSTTSRSSATAPTTFRARPASAPRPRSS